MALLNVEFFSGVLGMDTQMYVLLPEDRSAARAMPDSREHPVLYLLHGHSGDHSAYIRRSNIELLASELDLVVVMPNGHRGFYTDSGHGYQYFSFLAEELPTIVQNFFHVSSRREDSYVAGISMGGYGALKLALTYPERYTAAASLSGAVEPQELVSDKPAFAVADFNANIRGIFSSSKEETRLERLAESAVASGKELPDIYQYCGEQDMLFESNLRFAHFMEKEYPADRFSFKTEEGIHNWEYWNRVMPDMLSRLLNSK